MRKLRNEELDRQSIPEFKLSEKLPLVFVLDNVRSFHNVGSVFRTADAFSLQGIYLCGITAQPPHRDINKTALGATESVEWRYFSDTLGAVERLLRDGFEVLAVEQVDQGVALNTFSPENGKKYALVFGHEVHGVAQRVIDQCSRSIEIPQTGTKHSLNIAVSAGIVAWDFYSKFKSPDRRCNSQKV